VRFAMLDCVNGIEVNFGLLAKVPYAPIQKALDGSLFLTY
jgi:hypothetical protein